jgi:molybdopterin-dependent oxidoreductase alpha subunit
MKDAPAAGLKALTVTFQHARKQTGITRALRVLSSANQTSGFDCPGCAWPDPEVRSPFEFCENGAKAILDEATTRRVDAEFFRQHSVSALREQSERWLNEQGRLVTPAVLREGATHFEPVSYDEALALVARELRSLKSPHEAAFYTSGRASNEAAFLYQLMVRAFGTNNLPGCSNLCHESSGVALKETLGIGKGTVRLADFERADLIFVIGQNPGSNHPRMLSTLRQAKLAGAKIISVNPLVERGLVKFAHPQEPDDLLSGGVELADEFVRVSVNGDQALFRGLSKVLLASRRPDAIDHEFIREYCLDFEAYRAAVENTPWKTIEEHSGQSRAQIEALAARVLASKAIICTWAMGLTQHENAVVTIQEVTNFLLLRGNVGRPGAGVCPVRGHSNVQGDRTVGIAPTLPPDFATKLEERFSFPVPEEPGLDTVATIAKMHEGAVRAFVALGGNFLSASPDTEFTRAALSRCELSAHISTKLNKSHLSAARLSVLLPCLARSERDRAGGQLQFVTVENSMGIVHSSQGHMPPADESLLGEPVLVARLAAELLQGRDLGKEFLWLVQDYDRIRDAIEATISGFSSYNERVRAPLGFELPNGPRTRNFTTKSGHAHFIKSALRRLQAGPGELLLTTIRSHDQFNTTVYSDDDRYRGIQGTRKVLLLSAQDLLSRNIESGALLRITSHFSPALDTPALATPSGSAPQTRTLEGFLAVAYDIPPGTAAAYFPETNPLIFLDSYAERSFTPTSKSIRITIEKMAGSESAAESADGLT